MYSLIHKIISLIVGLALVPTVAAEDWPMLGRDRSRNPVSPEKNPPLWWQVEDNEGPNLQRSKNIKWQAKLGSFTNCDPVIANGFVWVGASVQDDKTRVRSGNLMCFREKDGKLLYQHRSISLPTQDLGLAYVGHTSSPLIEGDRAWFTTIRCETVCLDIGPLQRGDGQPKELWKVDMVKGLGVFPSDAPMGYGRTCSITASYKDRIYVCTGNGVDEEGKTPQPKAPSLVCFHKNTGKVLWTDSSPGKKILDGQWSSPLIMEIHGRGQVIVPQGDGWLRSFDAMSGELIWKFDASPRSIVDPNKRGQLLATPVYHDGYIYIGTGASPVAPVPPESPFFYCIDPTKKGDISPEVDDGKSKAKPNPNSGLVWRHGGRLNGRRIFNGAMSGPVINEGLVIVAETNGYLNCLDAKSGKHYWRYDVKDEAPSSPLVVDGKIYFATEGGDVHILSLAKELTAHRRVEMDNGLRTSPVFANGVLYLATRNMLHAIAGHQTPEQAGHWPQWRGPDRTNISREKGLLASWPEEGPPLAWKAEGLGTGPMSLSIADGRLFALGYKEGREYLHSLDEITGRITWSQFIGPGNKGNPGMDWLSQRSPTVDGKRVYAFGVKGDLVCMEAATGKELWRKHYVADFEGKPGPWGFCDFPLVDGDKLICTPGGDKAAIVALDKRTGAIIWQCTLPKSQRATYGATVLAERPGNRMYIHQLDTGTVAVAANDGKLLWQHKKGADSRGNVHTAILRDDLVFHANGWATGCGLLRLLPPQNEGRIEEIYYSKVNIDPWLGSSVLLGEQVHTSCGKCINFRTGKVLHDLRLARTTMTCAEGRLYHRTGNNLLLLHEYTSEGYVQKAKFQVPRLQKTTAPTWSFPVIAGGKLYLRD